MSRPSPAVVDRAAWQSARDALYVEERKFSKLKDAITEQRRQLPWLPVTTPHALVGAAGEVSLRDLFGSHEQLAVYHMMPFEDGEYPCAHCSSFVDQLNVVAPFLDAYTAVAVIAKAPPGHMQAVWRLRGWTVPVYACDAAFTVDAKTADHPKSAKYRDQVRCGLAVYHRGLLDGTEADSVFLTYDTFDRGGEEMDAFLNWLDRLPVVTREQRWPAAVPWERLYGRAPSNGVADHNGNGRCCDPHGATSE